MTRGVGIAGVLLPAALVAATVIVPDAGGAPSLQPPDRSISWLSIGDSYGAGEGATRAEGYCQRSPNAAGPKAAEILRTERGWTIGPEAFAACTGYLAADLFTSRNELVASGHQVYGATTGADPAAEAPNDQSLASWAAAQSRPSDGFDVITVSLGGNDIGFADIVTGCIDIVRNLATLAGAVAPTITGSPWEAFARSVVLERLADGKDPEGCSVIGDELTGRVNDLLDPDPGDGFGAPAKGSPDGAALGSLPQMYEALADELLAPDGVLIVLGYPRLIVPSSDWGAWRGNQCNMVERDDADALGAAAVEFDQRLAEAVGRMDSRFAYVSRLDVFDDGTNYHSLCGRGVEWLNTPLLFLRDGSLRKERGFHPNDLGYLATAESIAGVVESRLHGQRPAPSDDATTPTSDTVAPTVRSSEPHFDVGEDFDSTCTIAWPFAPSRGVESVSFRTTCLGIPAQFLFVDITYADPDLPVSPSRPRMRVRGTIEDISRSEIGFTVLVVRADEIDIF